MCHQQSTLTSISVTTKSRSLIFNKPTAEESSVKESFEEHLKTTTSEKLKDLLIFAAGAPCVPDFGLGKINVEFTHDSSTSSSTCLKKVTFPRKFPDNDTSLAAIHAVCDNAEGHLPAYKISTDDFHARKCLGSNTMFTYF